MRKAMWPQVWRMLLMYHCTALQSTGLSQLVENIQSRFSVKLIRTWGDSELPSLPLFKCLTLILFAIMCRCQGRIQRGISALCQVYMLFVVYQDFDKWEGSAMAGTLDYSPACRPHWTVKIFRILLKQIDEVWDRIETKWVSLYKN